MPVEVDFKINPTPQNRPACKVRFASLLYYELTLTLVNVKLPTHFSCRDIFISYVRLEISE